MSATKDAIEGAAAVSVAVALAGPAAAVVAAAAAAAPTLANLTVEVVRGRDRKRAQALLERMVEADEDPAAFADHLNARIMDEDPAVITAFRALLVASLEAVALGAIEPIALIGRQYVRNECPAWLARNWLRVLTELTEPELAGLRQLVRAGLDVIARLEKMRSPPQVQLVLDRGEWGHPPRPSNFYAPHAATTEERFASGYADRLFDLFLRNGLVMMLQPEQSVVQTPFPPPEQERFRFRKDAFDVIVKAFPGT